MQLKVPVISDCSDREYKGETGHLPTRLLNGEAEVTYQEEDLISTSPDLLSDPLCPPNGPTLSPRIPAAFGDKENPLPLFGESPTVSSQKKGTP